MNIKSIISLTVLTFSSLAFQATADGNHPYNPQDEIVSWSNAFTNNPNGNKFWSNPTVKNITTNLYVVESFGHGVSRLGRERLGSGLPLLTPVIGTYAENALDTLTYNNQQLVGIEVKEQAGYGIIDVRGIFRDISTASGFNYFDRWATGNERENWTYHGVCKTGYAMTELQVSHQHGFGIVDLRINCTPTSGNDSTGGGDTGGGNTGGGDIGPIDRICKPNSLTCISL